MQKEQLPDPTGGAFMAFTAGREGRSNIINYSGVGEEGRRKPDEEM